MRYKDRLGQGGFRYLMEKGTHYYQEYPGWVKQWNTTKFADKYKDTSWEMLHDVSTYALLVS